MSDLSDPLSVAADPYRAYVASLYAALGSRDPMEVLREMPAALGRATAGLSASQLSTREDAGKWSVRHVVQHLSDSELVGAYRFRMVLAHERPSLPGYDQDLWADRLHYEKADVPTSIADFTALRHANLRLLEAATPEDRRRVMHHAERGDESLEVMVRLYAGHDVKHLRQIARIRAAIGATAAAV